MKIPKKDGTTDLGNDACENWEDIICDKCGKSCRDDEGVSHEYATVEAYWGYGSKKDLYHDEAVICEPCYDGMGLKPNRTVYM